MGTRLLLTPKSMTMSLFRSTTTIHAILLVLYSLLTLTSSQASIDVSLIHRDSSLSPLYNPDESPYDRVRNSFVRSKARLAYLINMGDTSIGDFQGEIEANDGEYLVKYSIGTPPVEMVGVMDTASELVLARCLPCASCNTQTPPLFDSSKSLTYKNITCSSTICTELPSWACDSSDICSFVYGPADFSHSTSLLGSDTFTFETSNGVTFFQEDVVFGCKFDSELTSPNKYNGILGLGFHNSSLIFQMSSVTEPIFTYCLGNHSDPESQNVLVVGNGVFLEGQTTPLKVIEGRYQLVLEGLSVGKKRLPIPPEIFQPSPSDGGGVIIDTGTTLTFLAPDAYYRVAEEVEGQLGLDMEMWPDPPYERCYNGNLSDVKDFRGLIFHFERGVNVLMDVENLFLQVEDGLFCLAVLPSPVGEVSVLGNLFQQSYSVGYHLGEMLISFQRIDCEVMKKHLSGGGG